MSHITNSTSSIEGCRAELASIAAKLRAAPLRQRREDMTNISNLEIRLGDLRNKISLLIPSRLHRLNPSKEISAIQAEIAALKKEVHECQKLVTTKYEQIFRPNETKAADKEAPQNTGLLRTVLNSVWSVLGGGSLATTAPTEQPPIEEEEEFSLVEPQDLPPTKSVIDFMKHQISISEFIFLNNSSWVIPWETLLTAATELKEAWGLESACKVLDRLSDRRENHEPLSLFWAIINTSAPNKYEVARNLLGIGINPNYAMSTGSPPSVPKELLLNHENLLFILRLIKEEKLSPDNILTIRNSWNACDGKDRRKVITEALLPAGLANYKDTGWDSEGEVFSYVQEIFNTKTFLWKA